MRLTALFLLIGVLTVHARGNAQKVTIDEVNVPLQKVINIIKKQTGYGFNINLGNLDELPPVTVKVNGGSIKEALEQCLEDLPISYYIGDNYVVLGRKKVAPVKEEITNGFMPEVQEPISGYVYDSEGKPLAGAIVKVKNSTNVVANTGTNGKFELKLGKVGDVLVVSFVGFETQELIARTTAGNIVRLNNANGSLNDVQVIAYGITTRRLTTGNIGSVKADVIEKQPINNPLLALQGRVPGVSVVQNSGVPGGGITVRIQGRNSISSGNDPLYVVDGVPIASQLPAIGQDQSIFGTSGTVARNAQAASGNPLSFLNPSDIESIDVLKDADATAIYGSRAANGAILITTKSGKSGKASLDLNVQSGWSKNTGKLETLNTRQYLDMRYEAYKNDNIDWRAASVAADDLKVWDTTRYTNWQDELLRGTTAFSTASVSVAGGITGTTYLVSGTYAKEGVPFPGDFFNKRTSVHFNISSNSYNQRLRFKFSGNYMNNSSKLPVNDPTSVALFLEPVAPAPFNADGTLNWQPNAAGASTFSVNPYRGLVAGRDMSTHNLIGNIAINYKILTGLEIGTSLGYTRTQTDQLFRTPLSTIPPESRLATPNSANYSSRDLNSWIVEPQLSYKRVISRGRLDALIGATILESNTKVSTIVGQNYTSDALLANLASAATIGSWASNSTQYKYAAVFGRLNYNWQDQYIINITARKDGTSRFGSNNRLHTFGAIGGAWIFVKSGVEKNALSFLSFGKLKGSYGITGNDQIADFQYMSRYDRLTAQVPYQGIATLVPANLPNPNLKWESTRKLSVGVDLGFMNDRVLLNANYAKNTSENQLETYRVSSVTGFINYIANFPGTVRNTTWEFTLNLENIKNKHIDWSSDFNLTIPRNKLVAFPDLASSAYATTLEIGKSLGIQRLSSFIGVDPATGLYQFRKKHGGVTDKPVFTDDYNSFNLDPRWYGGVNNHLRVGSFSLDFFVQVVKQYGRNVFLGNGGGLATPGAFVLGLSNQPVSVLDRWQNVGDEVTVKKYSSIRGDVSTGLAYSSDAGYTDASFARLKNVSLSWSVPVNWLKASGFRQARFFVQAQNLITISGYKGLNPEVPSTVPLLPPMRVITLGGQIGF
ncbi:SusC/RagA family TonB-linked outer membrane protein [Filimonas effusa]|nr:SusC/RagA family TonB-linked outer membrane protein [Filimonas effusa]